MAPAKLKKFIVKLWLVGAFGVTAVLGFGQLAFARESGFLGQIFEREKAPVPSEPAPSAVPEPQDVDTPAPLSAPKKKAPPRKKAVANAPLPPPRPLGLGDAPSGPHPETDHASLGTPSSANVIPRPAPVEPRAVDETSTIPAPPTLAEPVDLPRRDVAVGGPSSALQAERPQTPEPGREVAGPGERNTDSEPALAAPLAPSESVDTSSTFDIAPDCKAVLLVRKGAFKTASLRTINVARGQIEDSAYAKLVVSNIPGIRVNLRDMDWTSGLQSMALGQVDAVLVGVDRQRPQDLQQVWLGFYELVQLPLTDSEAWSCPRAAS